MILPVCFSKEWLREQANALQSRDVRNLEKCVLALELVGRLKKAGLEFIFKGGTSLLLLTDQPRRLSIDVDILCLESQEKLEEVLDKVVGQPFLGWEHQEHRDREAPPTRHFRVVYESAFDGATGQAIQLDVIVAESPYAALESRAIQPGFIEVDEEVSVLLPSPSSLLGDKIAAFAPSTIGFPYQPLVASTGEPSEQRPIKVVKHLFDISVLAGMAGNIAETEGTYRAVHAEQVKYRALDCGLAEALEDTQDAAFWVSRVDGRPPEENEKTVFFRKGLRSLDSHLFSEPFQIAQARNAAGIAALVASALKRGETTLDLPAFVTSEPNPEDLRWAKLDAPWENLNRLKQTDPVAFACWIKAQDLESPPAS
jgi:hypothetical protein